jgi:tetratricopeptide (TPR) repeat protein
VAYLRDSANFSNEVTQFLSMLDHDNIFLAWMSINHRAWDDLTTEQLEKVVSRFLPLIEAGSKDPELFAAVSRAYHRMEHYKDALKLLSKAVEINPKNINEYLEVPNVK